MTTTRKALGRGLDALFGQPHPRPDTVLQEEELLEIDIDLIDPNPEQPRTAFPEQQLRELANSLRSNGLVQPILVRRSTGGRFQLIAGERRWRAAQLAGFHKLTAIVREVPDERLLEFSLVENIQRQELNPIEEALAYQRLIQRLELTQEQVAERVGKDRSSIANYLRLLKLAPTVQKLIEDDQLQMGHARALAGLESPELQTRLGREIARRRLSVRQAEAAVKRLAQARVNHAGSTAIPIDANIRAAELKLKRFLGTQVKIRFGGRSGKIEVSFDSMSDLDRIYSLIMRKTHVAPEEPAG